MQPELTINASAFKARCLDLMDQIASHKLSRVTITKRGKPVSVLNAPELPQPKQSIVGCMADAYPGLADLDIDVLEKELSEIRGEYNLQEHLDRLEKEIAAK